MEHPDVRGPDDSRPATLRLATGRLLTAVLQTLAEEGPSPTAFRASPAADFLCDGTRRRAAQGWWLVYATELRVRSSPGNEREEELVELAFNGGPHVHNGEPLVWLLSMTMDVYGVRRLVLHDQATYPEPLLHLLQYHAIGKCRERLLQQTAIRLGQQLAARGGLRAVFTGVLTALGLYRETAGSVSAPHEWNEITAAEVMSAPAHAPYLAPQQPTAPFVTLDETPRGAAAQAQQSVLGAIAAKIATTARSSHASAPTTKRSNAEVAEAFAMHASEATKRENADLAEAFALSSAAAVVDGGGGGGGGGRRLSPEEEEKHFGVSQLLDSYGRDAQAWSSSFGDGGGFVPSRAASSIPPEPLPETAAGSALENHFKARGVSPDLRPPHLATQLAPPSVVDDQVDSLRARMPDRSTESLREMVRQSNSTAAFAQQLQGQGP